MHLKVKNVQGSKEITVISPAVCITMFVLIFMIAAASEVSAQNKSGKNGFVKIFDGKTLKGWEGDPTYWRVENGSLVGEITPATLLKRNQFIIWRGGVTKDFEL